MTDLRWVEVAVSADAVAHQWARQENAPSGSTCVVRSEVAARVRNGREWRPERGIAVATIVRPAMLEPPHADLAWLAVTLAAANAMTTLSVREHGCWWPDQVGAGGDPDPSVAVTAASALGPGTVAYALLVVRVDVAAHPALVADDVATVTADGLRAASSLLDTPDDLVAQYTKGCRTLGHTVRVASIPTGSHLGTAVAVDDSGRLVLESPTGMRQAVPVASAGAVTLV